MTSQFDYDEFLRQVMNIPPLGLPTWIQCRSVEEAEAFAAWCVENGIEEPRVVVQRDHLHVYCAGYCLRCGEADPVLNRE